LPSIVENTSAPGVIELSWLNGWPACSPVNASRAASRLSAHDAGPMCGSLHLHRERLPLSTPCRFVPAHPHNSLCSPDRAGRVSCGSQDGLRIWAAHEGVDTRSVCAHRHQPVRGKLELLGIGTTPAPGSGAERMPSEARAGLR